MGVDWRTGAMGVQMREDEHPAPREGPSVETSAE